ncbi:hypothetical protein PoB_006422600 [Plakobranchus ocellatus]|uniref:Uncharacterized protein n=1 Tax=Plakobranchus ocellatus TaxID=259542 RepID=A0AAV4D0I0_9GAST|nr:hypothetical protein PoB_006422600 [Plakobranchus ocellatus]
MLSDSNNTGLDPEDPDVTLRPSDHQLCRSESCTRSCNPNISTLSSKEVNSLFNFRSKSTPGCGSKSRLTKSRTLQFFPPRTFPCENASNPGQLTCNEVNKTHGPRQRPISVSKLLRLRSSSRSRSREPGNVKSSRSREKITRLTESPVRKKQALKPVVDTISSKLRRTAAQASHKKVENTPEPPTQVSSVPPHKRRRRSLSRQASNLSPTRGIPSTKPESQMPPTKSKGAIPVNSSRETSPSFQKLGLANSTKQKAPSSRKGKNREGDLKFPIGSVVKVKLVPPELVYPDILCGPPKSYSPKKLPKQFSTHHEAKTTTHFRNQSVKIPNDLYRCSGNKDTGRNRRSRSSVCLAAKLKERSKTCLSRRLRKNCSSALKKQRRSHKNDGSRGDKTRSATKEQEETFSFFRNAEQPEPVTCPRFKTKRPKDLCHHNCGAPSSLTGEDDSCSCCLNENSTESFYFCSSDNDEDIEDDCNVAADDDDDGDDEEVNTDDDNKDNEDFDDKSELGAISSEASKGEQSANSHTDNVDLKGKDDSINEEANVSKSSENIPDAHELLGYPVCKSLSNSETETSSESCSDNSQPGEVDMADTAENFPTDSKPTEVANDGPFNDKDEKGRFKTDTRPQFFSSNEECCCQDGREPKLTVKEMVRCVQARFSLSQPGCSRCTATGNNPQTPQAPPPKRRLIQWLPHANHQAKHEPLDEDRDLASHDSPERPKPRPRKIAVVPQSGPESSEPMTGILSRNFESLKPNISVKNRSIRNMTEKLVEERDEDKRKVSPPGKETDFAHISKARTPTVEKNASLGSETANNFIQDPTCSLQSYEACAEQGNTSSTMKGSVIIDESAYQDINIMNNQRSQLQVLMLNDSSMLEVATAANNGGTSTSSSEEPATHSIDLSIFHHRADTFSIEQVQGPMVGQSGKDKNALKQQHKPFDKTDVPSSALDENLKIREIQKQTRILQSNTSSEIIQNHQKSDRNLKLTSSIQYQKVVTDNETLTDSVEDSPPNQSESMNDSQSKILRTAQEKPLVSQQEQFHWAEAFEKAKLAMKKMRSRSLSPAQVRAKINWLVEKGKLSLTNAIKSWSSIDNSETDVNLDACKMQTSRHLASDASEPQAGPSETSLSNTTSSATRLQGDSHEPIYCLSISHTSPSSRRRSGCSTNLHRGSSPYSVHSPGAVEESCKTLTATDSSRGDDHFSCRRAGTGCDFPDLSNVPPDGKDLCQAKLAFDRNRADKADIMLGSADRGATAGPHLPRGEAAILGTLTFPSPLCSIRTRSPVLESILETDSVSEGGGYNLLCDACNDGDDISDSTRVDDLPCERLDTSDANMWERELPRKHHQGQGPEEGTGGKVQLETSSCLIPFENEQSLPHAEVPTRASVSDCSRDTRHEHEDGSGTEDSNAILPPAPLKTQSLVNACEAGHSESAITDMMALISQEANIKRYPSFPDLTDLEDDVACEPGGTLDLLGGKESFTAIQTMLELDKDEGDVNVCTVNKSEIVHEHSVQKVDPVTGSEATHKSLGKGSTFVKKLDEEGPSVTHKVVIDTTGQDGGSSTPVHPGLLDNKMIPEYSHDFPENRVQKPAGEAGAVIGTALLPMNCFNADGCDDQLFHKEIRAEEDASLSKSVSPENLGQHLSNEIDSQHIELPSPPAHSPSEGSSFSSDSNTNLSGSVHESSIDCEEDSSDRKNDRSLQTRERQTNAPLYVAFEGEGAMTETVSENSEFIIPCTKEKITNLYEGYRVGCHIESLKFNQTSKQNEVNSANKPVAAIKPHSDGDQSDLPLQLTFEDYKPCQETGYETGVKTVAKGSTRNSDSCEKVQSSEEFAVSPNSPNENPCNTDDMLPCVEDQDSSLSGIQAISGSSGRESPVKEAAPISEIKPGDVSNVSRRAPLPPPRDGGKGYAPSRVPCKLHCEIIQSENKTKCSEPESSQGNTEDNAEATAFEEALEGALEHTTTKGRDDLRNFDEKDVSSCNSIGSDIAGNGELAQDVVHQGLSASCDLDTESEDSSSESGGLDESKVNFLLNEDSGCDLDLSVNSQSKSHRSFSTDEEKSSGGGETVPLPCDVELKRKRKKISKHLQSGEGPSPQPDKSIKTGILSGSRSGSGSSSRALSGQSSPDLNAASGSHPVLTSRVATVQGQGPPRAALAQRAGSLSAGQVRKEIKWDDEISCGDLEEISTQSSSELSSNRCNSCSQSKLSKSQPAASTVCGCKDSRERTQAQSGGAKKYTSRVLRSPPPPNMNNFDLRSYLTETAKAHTKKVSALTRVSRSSAADSSRRLVLCEGSPRLDVWEGNLIAQEEYEGISGLLETYVEGDRKAGSVLENPISAPSSFNETLGERRGETHTSVQDTDRERLAETLPIPSIQVDVDVGEVSVPVSTEQAELRLSEERGENVTSSCLVHSPPAFYAQPISCRGATACDDSAWSISSPLENQAMSGMSRSHGQESPGTITSSPKPFLALSPRLCSQDQSSLLDPPTPADEGTTNGANFGHPSPVSSDTCCQVKCPSSEYLPSSYQQHHVPPASSLSSSLGDLRRVHLRCGLHSCTEKRGGRRGGLDFPSRLSQRVHTTGLRTTPAYSFLSRSQAHLDRCDRLIERSSGIIRRSEEVLTVSRQQMEETMMKLSLMSSTNSAGASTLT